MTTRAHAKQDHARMLKTAGLSYQQIADSPDPTADPRKPTRLYASAGSARNAVLAARARHDGVLNESEITIAERRRLFDDRYERLIAAMLPAALKGDADARRDVLRAMRDQAELHGVKIRASAPVVDTGGEEDDPVDELAVARERRAADGQAGTDAAAPT